MQSVKNRSLNMFTLIGLGVRVAYAYSCAQLEHLAKQDKGDDDSGSFVSRRLPVFGSLQVWLAVTLAYSTFSGFCATTQALNGSTAVVGQQVVFGAGAAFLAVRGLRSMRRSVRGGT